MPAPVADAICSAEEVVLYSLEPGPLTEAAVDSALPAGQFHGHQILGQVSITGTADRKRLFAALRQGVEDHDGSVAACFIPHHGVRLRFGSRTVDLVVCFQCAQVKMFVEGKPTDSFLVSTSPRPVFNDLLDRAKVPVSAKGR
ncbi:MAG TPA: hypothetical protein VKD72_02170 [Gemmataceae bacterium]|nr:hypothetical protein [Gemmataceae bacterium]